MASKYSSVTKIKRALAALDSAVQEWYAEHNPENKERYADATFMDYPEDGTHISRISLNTDPEGKLYTDICSSKQHLGGKA